MDNHLLGPLDCAGQVSRDFHKVSTTWVFVCDTILDTLEPSQYEFYRMSCGELTIHLEIFFTSLVAPSSISL